MPSLPQRLDSCGSVAVVMSRFPAVTETFILRELIALEDQGVPVVLVPLLRDEVSTLHPEAAAWDARALYTPFVNGAILASNLRVFISSPGRYVGTLLRLLWEARGSGNALAGTLGIFPKSVYNGQRLRALGVHHVHAHFGNHPATAAYVMKRVRRRGEAELPYSLTLHAHDIFVHQAGLLRKLLAAEFVRSISRFNVEFLTRRFPGALDAKRFRVIHCGIDPARYRHRPRPGAPGRDRSLHLLSIAGLRPYKGLSHLIEAVGRMRAAAVDVCCDVIGDGPLRSQLEAQIARSGLERHVRLLGTKNQDEVARALELCDVFVLPSVAAPNGEMEGIPVALMESLAAGVPTVSTRLSGIPELVIDGVTGFLADPADPGALTAAVERIIDDYPKALEIAQEGSRLVRTEFEIGTNVGRLVDEIGLRRSVA